MALPAVSEKSILDTLHLVPTERWCEVLDFLNSLRPSGPTEPEEDPPIRTFGDLLQSGMVGLWENRTDIEDSREFARQLRLKASHRTISGSPDASGH